MSLDKEENFEDQIRLEEIEKEREKDEGTDVLGQARTRKDDDGTEYEWDTHKKAWFPKIDADFIAQYQMNYGTNESAPASESDNKTTSETPSITAISTPSATTISAPSVKDDHYTYWYHHHYSSANSSCGTSTTDSKVYEEYYKYCQQYYEYQQSQQSGDATTAEGSEADASRYAEWYKQYYTQQGTAKDGNEAHSAGKEGDADSYSEYYKQYYSQQATGKNTDWDDYWAQYYKYQPTTESKETQDGEDNEDEKEKSNSEAEGKDGDKKKDEDKKNLKRKPEPTWFDMAETDKNTNVYVTGLPPDITMDEFTELMNKFGLILFDPRTKKPKLKLYKDEKGNMKGDGLCCFIKDESVNLALQILDGSVIRGYKITVERAKFELKGSFDATKRKKKLSNKEKRKFLEKQEKLFDWRPDKPFGTREKREKVVVVKNFFDCKEIEKDPVLINELSSDIRDEFKKYGDVSRVVVCDRHPEAVVLVTFKEAEQADVCVEAVNGRWFAKRQLKAETWDGHTKYEIQETDKERAARLKKWEEFLEKGEKEDKDNSASEKNNPDIATTSAAGKQSNNSGNVSENKESVKDDADDKHAANNKKTEASVTMDTSSDAAESEDTRVDGDVSAGSGETAVDMAAYEAAGDTDSGEDMDDDDSGGRATPPPSS